MRSADEAIAADGPVPADIVAGMLAKRRVDASEPVSSSQKLPTKIYGIMAATTLLTFGALTTGYELLFTSQLFA